MYYIGVDVGGTNLVAGLVNEAGRILCKANRPVDKTLNAEQISMEIAQLTRKVCDMGAVDCSEVKAVGVGIPGLVDNKTGVIIKTTNMPFKNTPFRELFQKEWDIPVYLGNDANCAAIGEYWAGAAKGCDPAVVVTLGTGIGGGLVAGGKLFTGFANSGMEAGHMIIHPQGNLCPCGNRGCWEQYGSATALIRLTQAEMERDHDSKLWELCEGDINKVEGRTPFQGARLGDPAAKRVLRTYLDGLSVGLINLINILQPEIICVGGGVSNAEEELLLEPLRDLVNRGVYDKERLTRIERASLGNDAGVVGAALLCNMV